MNQDKWIYTDKRSGNLVLRFRVKGYDKQFFIGTGLADTPKNRKIVRLRRDLIAADIGLLRFDSSLESYQFQSDSNCVVQVPKVQATRKQAQEKYDYNLLQLWEKFTNFKKAILEPTTILVRYRALKRYIERLPTVSLEKAPEIRDWLLANTTHQMAWENLMMYSHCCDWAVDSGLIPKNPFLKLKIKPPRKKSDEESYRAFTLVQRDMIIEAFEQHRIYLHYAPLVKFLFWTGMRLGEAFALTWGDISGDCTRISISKSCNIGRIKKGTKNNRRRIFPTHDGSRLQQLLLDLRPEPKLYNPNHLIFTSKSGVAVNTDILQNVWNERTSRYKSKVFRYPGVVKELAAKGKVPYLKPYATRHTFATWAISSGISPDKVALLVGDEVETVLRHYCHPNVVEFECPDF
jgi:integrase